MSSRSSRSSGGGGGGGGSGGTKRSRHSSGGGATAAAAAAAATATASDRSSPTTTTGPPSTPAGSEQYESLVQRQESITSRLQVLSVAPPPVPPKQSSQRPSKSNSSSGSSSNTNSSSTTTLPPHQVPLRAKTDTHWDFVMKEMQWLATDFTSERRRHTQGRRKVCHGVRQHFVQADKRHQAALATAELGRRKRATKLCRLTQKFWKQMDQIVTYQQKLVYQQGQQRAMNRKLVQLVQQTERYTASLGVGNNDTNSNNALGPEHVSSIAQRKQLLLEQVLAQAAAGQSKPPPPPREQAQEQQSSSSPKEKNKHDNTTTNADTTSTSNDNPNDDDNNNKPMSVPPQQQDGEQQQLQGPPRRERRRRRRVVWADQVETPSQQAEALSSSAPQEPVGVNDRTGPLHKKPRVVQQPQEEPLTDAAADKPVNESSTAAVPEGEEEEEYHFREQVDDETTIAAEEQLGRDMSYQDEINLLQRESEMSLEELRAMYAGMYEDSNDDNDDNNDHNEDSNDDNDNQNDHEGQPEKPVNPTPATRPTSLEPKDTFDPVPAASENQLPVNETTATAVAKDDNETTVAAAGHTTEILEKEEDSPIATVPVMESVARENNCNKDAMETTTTEKTEQQENATPPFPTKIASVAPTTTTMTIPADTTGDQDKEDSKGESVQAANPAVSKTTSPAEMGKAAPPSPCDIVGGQSSAMDIQVVDRNEGAIQDQQEGVNLPVTTNQGDGSVEQTKAGKTSAAGGQAPLSGGEATNVEDDCSSNHQVQEVKETTAGRDLPTTQTATHAAEEKSSLESHEEKAETEEYETKQDSKHQENELETGDVRSKEELPPTEEEEEEYEFREQMDDETTIEAEEKLQRELSYEAELALLKKESEMSVDELRAMYAGAFENSEDENSGGSTEVIDSTTKEDDYEMETKSSTLDSKSSQDANDGIADEEDYHFLEQPDDETTIEAEEKLSRDISYEEELDQLKREAEMSVEDLRAMYTNIQYSDETTEQDSMQEDEMSTSETDSASNKRKREENDATADDDDRSKKLCMNDTEEDAGKEALSVLEQTTESAKNTLASRPYLLAGWVKLRAYQQVGLNWLVSMQTRRLNGILADEMGLGKTLQTIAMIAYLASYKGIWGPHLIVVPTSVIVNWETEFKRFCPALKVLCYYGSAKRRKELRTGWTKANWYHVVITSYQLAVQDAFAFKRKRWYYMVLDEAQNIKNFQSQRWQTLINFNTQRRLLLTGTPLQNSLMELWSLLHFLMPYIFRSRKEFSYWFENPMTDIIEGNSSMNDNVINRLHGIIRPFVLRRLKKDVETQMPGKYEHIVTCQLSRRQMLIYEEFMARSSTRKALGKGGNFMGMMNVLMQLRKVCNHPDLFEPRSIITPFVLDPVEMTFPSLVFSVRQDDTSQDGVSGFLKRPLWCGSTSEVSLENASRHDEIEHRQLVERRQYIPMPLKTPPRKHSGVNTELLELEMSLQESLYEANVQKRNVLNSINDRRCGSPTFPLSERLRTAVRIEEQPIFSREFNNLTTPAQLIQLRRSQQQRSEDCDEMIKKFVFCVPKAGVSERISNDKHSGAKGAIDRMIVAPIEEFMQPFERAQTRLSSFFPDKKLIQFDSGKLQTLAVLLRELKRGGHRTLIFTQMSKMLDILEAFLNLNGHTYLRLDGSTGVDRRQRMMDRFNNDPKIFCFILSTRSGGVGINLIGADTVCFFDSDWNPAMDRQAQDRVHRIGQTRDCHIYRLVTEHTIEENILKKAKQKQNLDILVMDKGKFNSNHLFTHDQSARLSSSAENDEASDVYTKGGLRAIFGVTESSGDEDVDDNEDDRKNMSDEQMETAMTALEDADDVEALKGAKKEAAEEMKEFDEATETRGGEDVDHELKTTVDSQKGVDQTKDQEEDEKAEQEALEKEFASWQKKVGMDKEAIVASLSPIERYGFHFREDVDSHVSIYAVLEHNRKLEEKEEHEDEIDIDEIEHEKTLEELQAISDGDLLGTDPKPEDLIHLRDLYKQERSRLKAAKKRRAMTGENWETRIDKHGKHPAPFFYNVDTGEAVWDRPRLLLELDEYEKAFAEHWSAMPLKPLVHMLSFLAPSPNRMNASKVCRHWHKAATDLSFILHVYPVEMGAYTRDESKMLSNHFRTLFDALNAALPGDTIEMSDGHYWANEDVLDVSVPVRIVGDEHNPTNVVVEMGGTMKWKSSIGGWIEGVTFRRPKLQSSEVLDKPLLHLTGKMELKQCVFDNEESFGNTIEVVGANACGTTDSVIVKGRVVVDQGGLWTTKKKKAAK